MSEFPLRELAALSDDQWDEALHEIVDQLVAERSNGEIDPILRMIERIRGIALQAMRPN